jgi:hypothetical protein
MALGVEQWVCIPIEEPWYFISRYPNLIGGCKMLWIFLEVVMAKDPKMGARVTIKKFL